MTQAPELALLNALPFPAALLDAAGVVLAANGLAETAFGAGLVGAPFAPLANPGGAVLPAGQLLLRALPGPERRALALVVDFAAGRPTSALAEAKELASKVKHDVNNVLMGLLGQTSLLQGRTDLPDAARAKIAAIEEQGRKIRDSVARLEAIRSLSDG